MRWRKTTWTKKKKKKKKKKMKKKKREKKKIKNEREEKTKVKINLDILLHKKTQFVLLNWTPPLSSPPAPPCQRGDKGKTMDIYYGPRRID